MCVCVCGGGWGRGRGGSESNHIQRFRASTIEWRKVLKYSAFTFHISKLQMCPHYIREGFFPFSKVIVTYM